MECTFLSHRHIPNGYKAMNNMFLTTSPEYVAVRLDRVWRIMSYHSAVIKVTDGFEVAEI